MARSLKDSYRMQLFAALAVNLAVYYTLINGLSLSDFTMETAAANIASVAPGGLAAVFCGILNSQLNYLQKSRIVFFRWRDPLPGCRAFSHYAPRDPRINMKSVRAKWSPLPRGAAQQNALWYRIYQQEQGTDAVRYLNKNWLFARDYTSMCVLIITMLGTVGALQMPSVTSWSVFIGVVLMQFLFARRSAVNYAERFVTTVIAQAASKTG